MKNQEWFNSLPIAPISSWQPVSGGDINEAYQVIADGIPYVINTPTPIASGDIDHDA